MKRVMRMALMVGVAVGALWAVSGDRGYTQAADPNAAPNPYKMQDNWLQLPEGRKLGAAIKVQVDHSDGKSIWVFDRCSSNSCANSMIPPIQKFDLNGKFVRAFGANMFVQPHGFYVDSGGNVWAADNGVLNGKGAVVVKFSPEGQVLMTLGRPGMPGNAEGFFNGASSVVVAPNGDIFVGDGHGGNTNDRVVKFDKTGKQIATWGKHGKGPGEFDQLHGIAMDSQGRIFVADRGNSRIQVFDSNGKFVAEWKQFGRPSDVAIDKNDVIYVTDDQSNQNNNPGFKTGIRIGSAKDGKVTAFIPTPSAEIATPEGVGFDDAGNVYGSWTGKMAVRRWTKS
jgi:sugar lactone lactonase YvrE